MSWPSRRRRPDVGSSKPAIMRSVVVFPQPLGPRKDTNSPRATSSSKCSTAVESANWAQLGLAAGVTISFGIAEYRGDTTADRLLNRADVRLYEAKNGGRNRVEPDLVGGQTQAEHNEPPPLAQAVGS